MTAPLYARYIPGKASVTESITPQEKGAETTKPPDKVKKTKSDRPKKRKERHNEIHIPDERPTKHQKVLSKFEKSSKIADHVREKLKKEPEISPTTAEEKPELHGKLQLSFPSDSIVLSDIRKDLTALPQPVPVREAPYQPSFVALPAWLANPISVPLTAKAPLSSFNIDAKLVQNLSQKGYDEALPVQTGILPLLLPGPDKARGDVCVSASTGSGKTLAYMVPIVQSLKERVVIKLRALIVVPTRELAVQVREVAELCTAGTNICVGIASGSRALDEEQDQLIAKGCRYDPAGYDSVQRKAEQMLRDGTYGNDSELEEAVMMLPGHVPDYESKVDILICTPGRLVDHVRSTRGFTLKELQWLIIDEADRLLDQSLQQWVEIVMGGLEAERTAEQLSARERVIEILTHTLPRREAKKVILSATMTRDLDKLSMLKLRRPTLVVLEGSAGNPDNAQPAQNDTSKYEGNGSFQIPPQLEEWAIPVGDGQDKPLFLLLLLRSRILKLLEHTGGPHRSSRNGNLSSDSEDDISSSSEPSSTYSSDSEATTATKDKVRKGSMTTPSKQASNSVLIFTKSNENAARLSHLLGLLHPPCNKIMTTLTKSTSSSEGRKALSAFRNGNASILVASDRASRGLDIPNLSHIVNYDVPNSMTAYIHRVGRTARAGKEGQAWTLFTDTEARWFWNAIARAPEIQRNGRAVQRIRLNLDDVGQETRAKYADALKQLQEAVQDR